MLNHDAIVIEAQDRATRDLQLERAVSVFSDKAPDRGILITRHSFGSFTATLSSDVEYGLIQELDLV